MIETPQNRPPDPGAVSDLADFVGLLEHLRVWAGEPSFRDLAKRVGALLRPPQPVSKSTIADMFQPGRRRLNQDLVVAIVRALGVDESTVDRWREACIKAHRLAKSGGPTGVLGQLPTSLATFTGRKEELARLAAAATGRCGDRRADAVVILAIEGMAGVGKTALAIEAAHELVRAGHFTDAQLHVNLRGFDPELPPADPSAVLEAFLRQLGVPSQRIPADRDERAAMYRDQLRGRNALVLLDNASDEAQVRDLIPAGPSCLVFITSRRTMAGLDGVRPHPIETFSEAESLELLTRIAGPDRTAAEPDAAARIVQSCDRLPLAVALAAARLRSRPAWRLEVLAARLDVGRLEAIRAGSRALRPVLDLSYQALPPAARRVFRLLGLHPGPDFSADAAAALAGTTIADATAALELLLDEHLLQQKRSGRYELHDLLRQHAAELAEQEESAAAREAAVNRIVDWYLSTTTDAFLRLALQPPRQSPSDDRCRTLTGGDRTALAWYQTEQPNLIAALNHTIDAAFAAGTRASSPRSTA